MQFGAKLLAGTLVVELEERRDHLGVLARCAYQWKFRGATCDMSPRRTEPSLVQRFDRSCATKVRPSR